MKYSSNFLSILYAENYGKQVTEHGQLCIVPWKFNGQSYEGCANPNNRPQGPWCPTKVNEDGQFEYGSVHWGYCSVMSRIRECLKEKGNILYDEHLYLDYSKVRFYWIFFSQIQIVFAPLSHIQ